MRKAILLLATLILVIAGAAATFAIDVNGSYDASVVTTSNENGVICAYDDSNITISITGATAGNQFKVAIDGTIWDGTAGKHIYDNGSGNCNPDATVDNNCFASATGALMIRVEVPTTEGIHDVNVYDTNGTSESATESIQIKPDSTYTEFTLTGTDGNGFCRIADYTAVSNAKVYNTYGEVHFTAPVDWSADISFDAAASITSDIIDLSHSSMNNKKATLTFKKAILGTDYEVYKDGSPCPSNTCTRIEKTSSGLEVDVTSFSKYEIKEASHGDAGVGVWPTQPFLLTGGVGKSALDVLIIFVLAVIAIFMFAKAFKIL